MSERRESRPLGLVFLGCGQATRMHSRTLTRLDPGVERHYASRSRARAREHAERFGGASAHGSYQTALADPGIDVALVATPPASHLELTRAALLAGKDAIVEKPAFLRSTDFDEVERLQERTGRRAFVAENYFYKPLVGCLRRLLADGAVGDPLLLHLDAVKRQETEGWRDEADLAGGGALFEGGIHWISLLAALGPEVRHVGAMRAGSRPGPERSMLVSLELEGGAAASLHYSWEVPSPLKGVRLSRIYGTRGTIRFESNGLFVAVWGARKRLLFPGLRDISGYRSMFADFLRALRTGEEAAYGLDRARRDLEIVERAYRAAGVPTGGEDRLSTGEDRRSTDGDGRSTGEREG